MDSIYIPSRGRYRTMSTHRHFQRHGVENWYYVVEPFDYANYVKALDEEGITEPEKHVLMFDVDIYKSPYHQYTNPKGFRYADDLGWDPNTTTGPGPARNALIDFARERGESHCWMMDDDITNFGVDAFRFQKSVYKRGEVRLDIVKIFELYERLLNKYENLGAAEMEKQGMAMNHSKNSHFAIGTKTYTCIRINTAIDIPWRGRWNDDVIYSLDYLWRGYVNLSSKIISYQTPSTQSQAGGMTEAFMDTIDDLDDVLLLKGAPSREEIINGRYQGGTLPKASLTKELFPAVADVVWKYSRPHHSIAYGKIEKELMLNDGTNLDDLTLQP